MQIIEDVKLDYADVLIRPKRSTLTSRKEVDLEREMKFVHSPKIWKGVPIMAANMDTCGTFEMARELSKYKMITCLHKFYTLEELKEGLKDLEKDYICYTSGIRDEDLEKLEKIRDEGIDRMFTFLCLDVPNGYLERFEDVVKKVREKFPEHILIAGNVVTNEMTEQLILSGADIVKVGIGSGSACLTRRKAGVGYPQLSASIECSDAAHGFNGRGVGRIIADGGAVYPSCVAKSFCAGSDFVMLGSMFSGFDQSGGELIEKDGKKFKAYYGMSSSFAMKKHYGEQDKHRASEGRYLEIPYKGDVNHFIQDLLGSLRSTATYIGARKLKEFSKRATFVRVSRQLNTSLAD